VETRIRERQGDVEIECVGEEAFVLDRLPKLVADLLLEISSGGVATPATPAQPQPPASAPALGPGLMSIAGEVHDYWSDAPIDGAKLKTLGLAPELQGQADAAGKFVMSGEVTGGTAAIVVTAKDYIETGNGRREFAAGVNSLTVFAVAAADLRLQLTLIGESTSTKTSTLIIDLRDAAGSPLEAVSSANLALSAGGNSAGRGPIFFGPAGFDSNQVMSYAFNGRALAMFLDVPAGPVTLSLFGPDESGGWLRTEMSLVARAGAVMLLEAKLPG